MFLRYGQGLISEQILIKIKIKVFFQDRIRGFSNRICSGFSKDVVLVFQDLNWIRGYSVGLDLVRSGGYSKDQLDNSIKIKKRAWHS